MYVFAGCSHRWWWGSTIGSSGSSGSSSMSRIMLPECAEEECTVNPMARRMFELVEPIGVIPYAAEEPNEAMFALGFTNYWDTYFAGRAAPLGFATAEVVDALFY